MRKIFANMVRGNVTVEIKCKQELLYLLTNCIELVYYNLMLTFNLTRTIKTASTKLTWLFFLYILFEYFLICSFISYSRIFCNWLICMFCSKNSIIFEKIYLLSCWFHSVDIFYIKFIFCKLFTVINSLMIGAV